MFFLNKKVLKLKHEIKYLECGLSNENINVKRIVNGKEAIVIITID